MFLRLAAAYSGQPITVGADNVMYDLLKEAYFRGLAVAVAYRDFGPDPQAGINKLVLDRVSLVHTV